MLVDSFIVDFAKMPATAEIMQKTIGLCNFLKGW